MRMTGKRQIGELQISELVTALMLSELAVAPISNVNISLLYAVIPITTLITLEIIITFIVTKSKFCKRIFDGEPSFIIKHGVLDQRELAKQRISVDEFCGELRLKDAANIGEVDYAIIEQNGKLSVFPKSGGSGGGIAHLLIIDGDINYNNLNISGRSDRWLAKRLSESKLSQDEIFMFSVDDAGNEIIIKKVKNK